MRNKRPFRLLLSLMAVVLCMTVFAVPAFASGGDETGEPSQWLPEETAPATEAAEEETTPGETLAGMNEDDLSGLLSALFGQKVTVDISGEGITITTEGTPAETVQTGTVTTKGSNLNVRVGPGLSYNAFTQLPNGTTVKVLDEENGWYQVQLTERTGYVCGDYLKVTTQQTGGTEGSSFTISFSEDELSSLLGSFLGGEGLGSLGDLFGGAALTPPGNLDLIDDIGSIMASGKQFITVESKNGNVFYLIIDRDDKGQETVHFLNQVDEADLLALMEDGETAAKPVVCSCTEKCQAGAVKTECAICMANMSECVGKEPVAQEPTEPEEPEAKGGAGAILAVVLILAAGGGAAYYFLVMKPRQGGKVPSDLDDLDLEDEEYYDDEETEDTV